MTVTAEKVLDEVNAAHRSSWQLLGRLSGGYQSGAYLIVDPGGRRAVLKWTDSPGWAPVVLAAAPVVASARAAGWPTPCWLAVGRTAAGYPYQVQEFVEGTSQEVITHEWLDLTLPVVARQAGLGRDGMRDWSSYDQRTVFTSTNHNRIAVATSEPAGAHLSEVITQLTRPHVDVVLPADDLVHGDFHPENVLIAGRQVAAVIDVEALGRGTRLHDLTTLLLYDWLWGEHEGQDRLTSECRSIAAPGWVEISLSAVTIDLLAYGVRHWPPDDLADSSRAAAALLTAQTT